MRPGLVFLFLYEIFLFLSEFLFLYVFVKFFNSVISTDRRERRNLLDMKTFKTKCRKRPYLVTSEVLCSHADPSATGKALHSG